MNQVICEGWSNYNNDINLYNGKFNSNRLHPPILIDKK